MLELLPVAAGAGVVLSSNTYGNRGTHSVMGVSGPWLLKNLRALAEGDPAGGTRMAAGVAVAAEPAVVPPPPLLPTLGGVMWVPFQVASVAHPPMSRALNLDDAYARETVIWPSCS